MFFRQAAVADIPQIQKVRHSVLENRLSNPALVTDKDVEDYIINRGRGWVCGVENTIVGFAVVSIADNNVWALFIQPGYDKKGIGKRLHDDMMDWYFDKTNDTVWLGTAAGTRAEKFYRKEGWLQAGITKSGEVKFEMTKDMWKGLRSRAI